MPLVTERQAVTGLITRNLYERDTRRPGQGGWELNIAGRCEKPCFLLFRGDPDPLLAGQGKERATSLYCGVWVRCRHCAWCLKRRRALWAARAVTELARASRTWFVTLTLSPANHALMLARAIVAGRTADTADATYRARHWAITRELTLYLKRLRKTGGLLPGPVRFRYALVAERHDGKRPSRPGAQTVRGMPHYHLFVHELDGAPLRMSKVYREDGSVLTDKHGRPYYEGALSDEWELGHVVVKLVDQECLGAAANYLAKYLAKDARARVRASVRYGAPGDLPEQEYRSFNIGGVVPSLLGTPVSADRGPCPHPSLAVIVSTLSTHDNFPGHRSPPAAQVGERVCSEGGMVWDTR